jgi:hypothetical protein
VNAEEKRATETLALQLGLKGIAESDQGQLIELIAAMVNSWQGAPNRHGEWIDRHKFLRDLFSECDAKDRQEMYNAIVPRLTFKAKPLSHYETMMAERVGNLVSKRAARVEGDRPRPIEIGESKYMLVAPRQASNVVATVVCHRCGERAQFVEPTAVSAMTAARRAGWTREKGVNKETCPPCSEAVAATVVKLANGQHLAVYDRRAGRVDALDS